MAYNLFGNDLAPNPFGYDFASDMFSLRNDLTPNLFGTGSAPKLSQEQKIKRLEEIEKKLKKEIANLFTNSLLTKSQTERDKEKIQTQAKEITVLRDQLSATQQQLNNVVTLEKSQQNEATRLFTPELNEQNKDLMRQYQQLKTEQMLLIQAHCALTKKIVTCSVCSRIFVEPTVLPCSNSICKSHLEDFKTADCKFCNQRHEIKSNDLKLNEGLIQTITMGLHLTEQERKLKDEIEQLFIETRSLTPQLKNEQVIAEKFCNDHFAKIINTTYFQREKLKVKIDELCVTLIHKVNECKSKFDTKLELNASKKQLSSEEIEDLQLELNDQLREVNIATEKVNLIKENLSSNKSQLTEQINEIGHLIRKIESCSIQSEDNIVNSDIFGDLSLNAD